METRRKGLTSYFSLPVNHLIKTNLHVWFSFGGVRSECVENLEIKSLLFETASRELTWP